MYWKSQPCGLHLLRISCPKYLQVLDLSILIPFRARELIVTMFDDDTLVFSAMRVEARGYILKGAKHD
jgi:DNA-binding NarL/FixJ family response regulator